MYAVARMSSSITRSPKGFLKSSKKDGLKFSGEEIKEEIEVSVFADASFAPDSEDSQGCFVVFVNQSPAFWKSGRQGLITLSTAEAEMTEVIDFPKVVNIEEEEEVKIRDEVRRGLSHTLGPEEEEEENTWIPKTFLAKF